MINGLDELNQFADPDLIIDLMDTGRSCGSCQLCCKLVPVKECGKAANEKCLHQKVGKGCVVYNTPMMPAPCRIWSCAWLVGAHTEKLSRPDRAHFVIDPCFDILCIEDSVEPILNGRYRFLQIWVDPKYRDSWRTPELYEYVRLYESKGKASMIRYANDEAFLLVRDKDGYVLKQSSLLGDPNFGAVE